MTDIVILIGIKFTIPNVCDKCFEIKNFLSGEKIPKFDNIVDRLYIQNFQTCNLSCVYCSFANVGNGSKYKIVPMIKSLIENKILSQNALVYMSGGEITISPEFDELFSLLLNYVNSKIEIFTSGIKYSQAIEKAFINNRCSLLISMDSGSRQTYLKIKRADKFDILVNNLKRYTAASDFAKENIKLKYIIVDGINDNEDEINKFFDVVKMLEIKNVRIDVDCVKYSLNDKNKIPPNSYVKLIKYFKDRTQREGLKLYESEQVESIMEKIKLTS